jgi:hypothetical protein
MLERIMGVITLKAPIYRQIADDQTATPQALLIVVVALLVSGFFGHLVSVTTGTSQVSLLGAIAGAIGGLIIGLVAWVFTSWVLSFVAGLLNGKTNLSEMLRVTGYVHVFDLVSVLNIALLISTALGCVTALVSLVVFILSLIGYVIGVREAAEFSTGNAIITAIIAAIVNFLIVVVIGGAVIGAFLALASITR